MSRRELHAGPERAFDSLRIAPAALEETCHRVTSSLFSIPPHEHTNTRAQRADDSHTPGRPAIQPIRTCRSRTATTPRKPLWYTITCHAQGRRQDTSVPCTLRPHDHLYPRLDKQTAAPSPSDTSHAVLMEMHQVERKPQRLVILHHARRRCNEILHAALSLALTASHPSVDSPTTPRKYAGTRRGSATDIAHAIITTIPRMERPAYNEHACCMIYLRPLPSPVKYSC